MKKEEWLPIVDEKGEVTGQAPRSICHSGSKLLHPVVHLHITNDRHELFLQKRSMKKDLLPGMWDTAVGGHIGVNEKVEDALKREASEELGITDFEPVFWVTTFGKVPANGNWFFLFYVPVTTISTSITMKWTKGVFGLCKNWQRAWRKIS